MRHHVTRSNEPIFWGLFGAGGTWGALFAPGIILVMLLMPALGMESGRDFFNLVYGSILGRIFMFLTIVLPVWAGMHRIHHCLHDLKVHSPVVRALCYAVALLCSLAALFLLFFR